MKQLSEMSLEELWQLFPIELTKYNPDWPFWYKEEETALNSLLKNNIKRIDHIGSTSVKGLISKPIVDILLQILPTTNITELKYILANSNWLLMNEQTSPDFRLDYNKGYTPNGFANKVFHLHIRYPNDYDEIYFRNYLRNNPKVAYEYVALKQSLLKKYKYNRDAYTNAKSDFIISCVKKARTQQTKNL